jgi:prolyl oligopeptidase
MYPTAPRVDLVDTLHGVAVADPFRPLENAADPATMAWVDAENALTRRQLDGPSRDRFVERLRVLHRCPRVSMPALRGDRRFFLSNDGSMNQFALVVRDSSGRNRVLLDPNVLDPQGTTAITAFEPDEAGERVVYATSKDGSDIQELQVLDVTTGRHLPDRIRWVKFASIAWNGDGFFYTRYPEPGAVPAGDEQYFCRVWFHRLGELQVSDTLVYERPDAPQLVFDVDVTSDGGRLVVTTHPGASDKAEVHVADLAHRPAEAGHYVPQGQYVLRHVVGDLTSGWRFIDGLDGLLYFRTDAGAARGRIVEIDLSHPTGAPRAVVAESENTIVDARVVSGRLLVSSLRNASSRLEWFELDGTNRGEVVMPGIGSILSLAGGWHDAPALATFASFTSPPTLFECDANALVMMDAHRSLPFNPSDYTTDLVWYPAKDGTPISMFLVKRGRESFSPAGSSGPVDQEGTAEKTPVPFLSAVLLTGYGGFNISLTPSFDPSDFLWLDAGGTIAVAHLRGGGEYGDGWHQAGMLERKQTVFDDFIAAAEWLTATGRAAPGRIAIEGGSNGGLLVAAVMVQRPDLAGAVICRVPVADMLRYHLFTVGRFWIPEYGSADDPQQFAFLRRYSPYHNVADGVRYPPTLVMTADTDDRVDPGMAKKFAARLQEAVSNGGGPILLRVEMQAGHGAGKPLSKQIDEQADMCEFVSQNMTRTTDNEQQRR